MKKQVNDLKTTINYAIILNEVANYYYEKTNNECRPPIVILCRGLRSLHTLYENEISEYHKMLSKENMPYIAEKVKYYIEQTIKYDNIRIEDILPFLIAIPMYTKEEINETKKYMNNVRYDNKK